MNNHLQDTIQRVFRLPALLRALVVAAVLAAAPSRAPAQPSGPMPTNVGFDTHFGERAPRDARLLDEQGRAVRLGDYFRPGRPVVLVMAYFECPMLCSMVLNGATESLRATGLPPAEDWEMVVVSIDPRDTPERAAAKKASYVKALNRPRGDEAMHFLTGREEEIRKVADGVGFKYQYDPISKQYAHAGGLVVLSPDGVISRYFYGIDFDPRDLRLGLVEAADGKVGTAGDRLLLLCYHYDPQKGTYGAAVMRVMRAGGAVTVALLGISLVAMRRKGRGKRRPPAPGGEG